MACTTCGSTLPCGCASCVTTSGTVVGVCQPAECQNLSGTPTPYYNCAPTCVESNLQRVTINQFSADLKVLNTWNVPNCGLTGSLTITGLKAINIGSYLWNAQFGYFEVTAFNAATSQVTVVNHCTDGNAAAGTNVPACTEFTVTDPPVEIPSQAGPCVAIDFTAPAISDCLDITLTTVTGVISGAVIQIGSGFYRVSSVKPNDIITICNDGDGILQGTAVIAQDAQGNYQYCLTLLSSNPCEGTTVTEGTLVVCADGALKRLNFGILGYVPVVTGQGPDTVEMRPPVFPSTCTHLTSDVNIVNGTDTYNIAVGTSALFGIGTLVTVGQQTGTFNITSIPDAFHIVGTFTPMPGFTYTIGSNNLVCNYCSATQSSGNAAEQSIYTPAEVIGNGFAAVMSSLPAEINLTNTSICHSMPIMFNGDGGIVFITEAAFAHTVTFKLEFNIDSGGWFNANASVSSYLYREYFIGGTFSRQFTQTRTHTLLPGASINIKARLTVEILTPGVPTLASLEMRSRVSGIGIAV